jgi:hypothetical protein
MTPVPLAPASAPTGLSDERRDVVDDIALKVRAELASGHQPTLNACPAMTL